MSHIRVSIFITVTVAAASTTARTSAAQEEQRERPAEQVPPSTSESDLAKKTQNPISDLISIPLQSNFYFGAGPDNRVQYVLNVQPVVPVAVSDDWLLVNRVIVPLTDQPAPAGERTFGLGDTQYTVFASPRAKVGPLTVGVGPALQLPTATSSVLGSGKWALGPSVVGLATTGPWVLGALVTNLWSFAGESDRADVRSLLVQPFVNYNLPNGWAVGLSPIITANWERSGDDRWTLPVGPSVSKVIATKGGPPLQVSAAAFWNVVRPNDAPDGQVRLTLALLLPR
jgi:hypothetical protein